MTSDGVYRTEAQLTAAIVKAVKAQYPDALVMKLGAGGYQRAGLPDLLLCLFGRFVFIEVKNIRPGETEGVARGRVTRLQQRNLEAAKCAGGLALVALSVAEVTEFLRSHCIK